MADADPRISAAADEASALAAVAPPEPETKRRAWVRPVLMFGVPLLIALIGGYLYLTTGRFVSTDNAYVQQDKVAVSADVAGRIVEVAVRENQSVKAGDLLFRIDPEPYRIAAAQADASLANAQVSVATLTANYKGTSADIAAARDAIQMALEDYGRQSELMKRGFTTRARL